MSFKDKKPEFFRMGSGDNLVYSVGAVDEYLAIVESMAEKYDEYAKKADKDIKALNNSLRFYEDKLEAVKKTWLENAKTMSGDPELNDVLCEIGTALTEVHSYDLEEMMKAVEAS